MSRHGRKKDRLKPTERVSENYARKLAARFVPVKISHTNPDVNAVPACCAEFYKLWLKSSSDLSKLKLDTVTDLAVEAFKAEGGKLTITVDIETVQARETAPNKGLPVGWFPSSTTS
jgi:hypothetical protein